MPLSEIIVAAGCSKASASDYRCGRRTLHVSMWRRLVAVVGVMTESAAPTAAARTNGPAIAGARIAP